MTTETKQCPECGETILAVAKKCKHCQTDLTKPASTQGATSAGSPFDIGAALLAVPVVGTLLAWFWIGNMNLLQSPGNSLALVVVATICITALLAAIEASKVGATSDRTYGTYSPVQWFFVVALLWIVGYPAYLFKRRHYGLKNYLWAGLAVMAVFLASAVVIQSAIDSRISEIKAQFGIPSTDDGSLVNQVMGLFQKSPQQKAQEARAESRAKADVIVLLNQASSVKAGIAEYYANNGTFPASCADVGGCTTGVSVSAGGRVTLNLGATGVPEIASKSVVVAPSVAANYDVHWSCGSDADSRFIPTACQNALATLPAPALAPAIVGAPAHTLVGENTPADAAAPAAAAEATALPAAAEAPKTATSDGGTSAIVAAPADQVGPSFDCAKAASSVEKMICSNAELAAADSELAAFYKKNIVASGVNAAPIKQGQRMFISKRENCKTTACVAEAYRARYEELAQMGYVRE